MCVWDFAEVEVPNYSMELLVSRSLYSVVERDLPFRKRGEGVVVQDDLLASVCHIEVRAMKDDI